MKTMKKHFLMLKALILAVVSLILAVSVGLQATAETTSDKFHYVLYPRTIDEIGDEEQVFVHIYVKSDGNDRASMNNTAKELIDELSIPIDDIYAWENVGLIAVYRTKAQIFEAAENNKTNYIQFIADEPFRVDFTSDTAVRILRGTVGLSVYYPGDDIDFDKLVTSNDALKALRISIGMEKGIYYPFELPDIEYYPIGLEIE